MTRPGAAVGTGPLPAHGRLHRLAWAVLASTPSCVFVGCDTWFYDPDHVCYETRASYGLEGGDVWFSAPEGPDLHGWWIDARGAAQGTVVYCHGYDKNISYHARPVSWLPARGFNLLVFDYRGFGRSAGTPTRAGTVDDAVAAIDFALARDPDGTVVFGHSLGGAIGIVAAARRPAVRAVVAESAFPSYRAAARCTVPALAWLVPLLISEGLDPIDSLSQLPPRPLYVIHGSEDARLPLRLGLELFRAALPPKRLRVVEGGGHASPWGREGVAFEVDLAAFFRAAIAAAQRGDATDQS